MLDIIRANYEMTAEECDLYVKLFHKAEADQRFYLLKIREEKGWKAKGFLSFDDFGREVLGCDVKRLYQLAKAAEVQLSLSDSTNGRKIPERTLRPLAPLTADERRQVWDEATTKAAEEHKKLTAKMVQEAVDRLKAEQAQIQARLDLAEQRTEEWRQQSITTKRTLTEAEQKLQVAQSEAASLRRTLAAEAEKLAAAKLHEVQTQIAAAKDESAKLKDTIKSLKRERDEAVQRGVANKLREQQTDLDRKEAQLVTLEKRIALLRQELEPLEAENRALAHHQPRIQEADQHINAIAVLLGDAFDPDFCAHTPEPLLREWERGAGKLQQLIDAIHAYVQRAAQPGAEG